MTFPEFKRALGPERMNFGLDDDDLQHLFNHCDVDGSGDVSYAELTRALGTQHYRLYSPEALASRPLVILVSGITLPGVEHMAPVAEALSARGLPVLVFDLFGRGLSDRPLVRYDGAFFSRGLVELLGALGLDGKLATSAITT